MLARGAGAMASRDEAVRRYLRAVVGAPIGSEDEQGAERAFVKSAAAWAERAGVDRRALAALGVSAAVLDAAGIKREIARERLRRYWRAEAFTVGELARWSGSAEATVRDAVAADVGYGALVELGSTGRSAPLRAEADTPMTKAYGVPSRRTFPLRLPRHADAPSGGAFKRWLRESDRPLAIDLFSGAGGLSLGLEAAGYRVAVAVDLDEWALETHAHNFAGLALSRDLGDDEARDGVVALFEGVEVDLVAGGPPCQPYSHAGRSKIRSLVDARTRDADDHRRELWRAFVDIVERVRPRTVMMENVPDMALGDDGEVVRHILGRLEAAGYNADARLVDTWVYGVPQHRQRLVLVGVAEGSGFEWPMPGDEVTLRDAISDLPVLDPMLDEVGAATMQYAGPLTEFQRVARYAKKCTGDDTDVVYDHVTHARCDAMT